MLLTHPINIETFEQTKWYFPIKITNGSNKKQKKGKNNCILVKWQLRQVHILIHPSTRTRHLYQRHSV